MSQTSMSSRLSEALRDLESTRRELMQIRFGTDMLERARRFRFIWSASAKTDEITRLHAKATTAELFDYFGRFANALETIETDASRAREQIEHIRQADAEHRDLWMQRLWVLLGYVDCLYWSGRYEESIQLVAECQRALFTLNGGEERSLRMQARLALARGRGLRQLDKLDEAVEAFMDSTDLADRQLRSQLERRSPAGVETETYWLIARALVFGIGWIGSIRGEMSTAQLLTMAGRALMRGTQDGIRKAYAEMQAAAIQRVRAGTDRNKLRGVIETLTACHHAFDEWGHDLYRSRAAFELAMAHFHAGNRPETENALHEVKEGFSEDSSVLARAFILESRIADQDVRRRLSLAEKALGLSQRAADHLSNMESLIAIGEAHYINGRQLSQNGHKAAADAAFRAAQRTLENARQRSGNNKKLQAVSCLHLSKALAGLGEHSASEAALREAESLCREIEWRVVHEMVAAERNSRHSNPFMIPTGSGSLVYKAWLEQMQRFLVAEAERRVGRNNTKAVARELAVSRPTLYAWRQVWQNVVQDRAKLRARGVRSRRRH